MELLALIQMLQDPKAVDDVVEVLLLEIYGQTWQ